MRSKRWTPKAQRQNRWQADRRTSNRKAGQVREAQTATIHQFAVQDPVTGNTIAKALGAEIRYAREAAGLSRASLVEQLPSGIGERTLLSYEHGGRQLTVIRLIEISQAMQIGAPSMLGSALQRARIHLDHLTLRVDLRALLRDNNMTYKPMFQWARNRLNAAPDGIIEVSPTAVRELAAFIGRTQHELTIYLARFTPDPDHTEIRVNSAARE